MSIPLPTPCRHGNARPRRCLNWHFLDAARHRIPFCQRWNCPVHGWDVRSAWADECLLRLPQERDLFTIVFHLNRRVPGKPVGEAATAFRDACRRALPGSLALVFVHVSGAVGALPPFPHLHCLLFTPYGSDGTHTLLTVGSNFTCLLRPDFPALKVKPWRPHDNPVAAVLYAYKARKQDKNLPVEQLPQSGDCYRLRYPRRGRLL